MTTTWWAEPPETHTFVRVILGPDDWEAQCRCGDRFHGPPAVIRALAKHGKTKVSRW